MSPTSKLRSTRPEPVAHLCIRAPRSLRGALLPLILLSLLSAPGCLEKQPDSEITIDGSYGGVGGSANALGETRIGDVTGAGAAGQPKAQDHAEVSHEDRPPGFGADPAEAPPEEANPGADPAPVPTAEGGEAPAHLDVQHEDKPAGFGAEPSTEEAPGAGGEAPPHEERAHVDRPPGFGIDDAVAEAPPGAPGGSTDGGLPQAASPFERTHKGEPMVTVSGRIDAPEGVSGIGDLDCFVPAPESPARRSFVNKIKIRVPGPYEMKVPKGFGPLILSAFLDVDQDGPDPEDPQGGFPDGTLTVGEENIEGVDISLETRAR